MPDYKSESDFRRERTKQFVRFRKGAVSFDALTEWFGQVTIAGVSLDPVRVACFQGAAMLGSRAEHRGVPSNPQSAIYNPKSK